MTKFDYEELRLAGHHYLPALADLYEEQGINAYNVIGSAPDAFGTPTSIPNPLAEMWKEEALFFYEVLYEVHHGLRAVGPTLVRAADKREDDEGELSKIFDEYSQDVKSGDYDGLYTYSEMESASDLAEQLEGKTDDDEKPSGGHGEAQPALP